MFGDFKSHCQIEATIQSYAFFQIGGMKIFFGNEKLRPVDVIAVNAVNFRAEIFLPHGKPTADAATDIDDALRVNKFGNKR